MHYIITFSKDVTFWSAFAASVLGCLPGNALGEPLVVAGWALVLTLDTNAPVGSLPCLMRHACIAPPRLA